MFQAGRFTCGLGIGVLVTICPMYLFELAPPAHRGWLVGHHAISLVFGYMLAAWLGFATYFATSQDPSFAWRFPLAVQCLSPTILLVTSIWIPQSPRWLLQKGLHDEAWEVLKRLRFSPDDPEHTVAKEEYHQAREQLTLDANKLKNLGVGPWGAVLKVKSYRKRMIVGFLTQWGAEFGGPLVIVSIKAAYPIDAYEWFTDFLIIMTEQLSGHPLHESQPNRLHAFVTLRSMAINCR